MYDTACAECGDAICREFSTLQSLISLLGDSLHLQNLACDVSLIL